MALKHLDERLFHHLRGAERSMEVLLQREFKEIGLPLAQFYVLSCLWQKDGVTQSWIGRKTFMTEGVTSQLIKEMVKTDRVEQRRDENDKRKRLIFLKPAAVSLKGPALNIWAQALKAVSAGIIPDQLSDFTTIAGRMRLNALAAYQYKFGELKEVRGETLNLIEALTLNTTESLSVINADMKFVYMNEKFREFFEMPEHALKVGDLAHKFYRRIAQNPRYNIKDTERYVFERINELRNLKTQNSIVRRTEGGSFFRITQRRLEDDSVMTTTERILNEDDAKTEMASIEAKRAEASSRKAKLRSMTTDSVTGPLRNLLTCAEALRRSTRDMEDQSKLNEIESAISTCLLRVEKAVSEF